MKHLPKSLIAVIILASLFNLSVWYFLGPKKTFKEVRHAAKVAEITSWLDQISPNFIKDLETMVKKNHAPSWGCGPTSYALAKIINKRTRRSAALFAARFEGSKETMRRSTSAASPKRRISNLFRHEDR